MRTDGEFFWRGPIRSRAQALRITRVAAWVYLGLGALSLLSFLSHMSAGPRRTAGDLVVLLLLAVPGGFLLKSQSRIAAGVMLALSGLMLAMTIAFGLSMGPRSIVFFIVILVFYVPLLCLSWRAFRAARAFHRDRYDSLVQSGSTRVFD